MPRMQRAHRRHEADRSLRATLAIDARIAAIVSSTSSTSARAARQDVAGLRPPSASVDMRPCADIVDVGACRLRSPSSASSAYCFTNDGTGPSKRPSMSCSRGPVRRSRRRPRCRSSGRRRASVTVRASSAGIASSTMANAPACSSASRVLDERVAARAVLGRARDSRRAGAPTAAADPDAP